MTLSPEREKEIRDNLPDPNWITVPIFAKDAMRELLAEIDYLRAKQYRENQQIDGLKHEVGELTKEVSCLRESHKELADWISKSAVHDESHGPCYGRLYPRPHPSNATHKCKCGLDNIKAKIKNARTENPINPDQVTRSVRGRQ